MTIMCCDKVIISIQLSIYQINWIAIESNGKRSTLNRLTMMLCDDSESIQSNQIASYRFDQDDVEPTDHDAFAMIVCQLNQTEYRRIDSNKATLNQLTMMLGDDS